MVWRTLALSAVNVVTALLIFFPLLEITTTGMEDSIYLHSAPIYFFLIQVGLGVFAVVIDMLNKKVQLQSKLIASAVVLSGTYAGIVLWLSFTYTAVGHLGVDATIQPGAWLPLFNVIIFFVVWVDQRRNVIK